MKTLFASSFLILSAMLTLTACNPASQDKSKVVTKVGTMNVGRNSNSAMVTEVSKKLGISFSSELMGIRYDNDNACVSSKTLFNNNSKIQFYGSDMSADYLETCHNSDSLWDAQFIYTSAGGASYTAKCYDSNCVFYSIVFNLYKVSNNDFVPAGQVAYILNTYSGEKVKSLVNTDQKDNQAIITELENNISEYGNQ